MTKRIAILFPHEWVAYSPTILNLVELLISRYKVRVFTFDNGKYEHGSLDPEVFNLIRLPLWIRVILTATLTYKAAKALLMFKATRYVKADIVIGVDSIGFYVAQKRFGNAHLLSLEIERDWLQRNWLASSIQSIAIQSAERLEYLFPEGAPAKVFYLPNSPILVVRKRIKKDTQNRSFIFLGNVLPCHGIYLCIEAIRLIPGTTLTIKGSVRHTMRDRLERRYQELFNKKRLIFDTEYIPQCEVIGYLQGFEVGFCFYDFRFLSNKDVNYITSPSGKIYNYFAAGVPVIGNNIPGLNDVKVFGAGILLDDVSANSICNAVHEMRDNYSHYREGCFKASEALDFSRCSRPYIDFLLGKR